MTAAHRLRRSPAAIAALAVFVVGGIGLTATRHSPHLALAPAVAIRDALKVKHLAHVRYDRATASAVDGRLVRVTFYTGTRVLAEVAVRRDGTIRQALDFRHLNVPYGDWISYEPVVLVGLAVLFVLMVGVAPLWRVRNLDVIAVLSLVVPVVLLQHRYLGASVLAAVPGIAYLIVRSAWRALGPDGAQPADSIPLFDRVTPGLDARERVRVLRLFVFALVAVVAMVAISSADAVDVIYAVMEGATNLIHGVLPYGHLPGDVIHGDTYPILSYALYAPLAWLSPVNSNWDSVDGALAVSVLAALVCAGVVYLAAVGGSFRAIRAHELDPVSDSAGLRGAIASLSMPLVMITVSTGTTDVVLAALLSVTVMLRRRPLASAGWLAAAGWFKLAPFALVPIWLAPLRGRQLIRATAAIAAVSGAMAALLVGLGGTGGPMAMVRALSFQFSRGSPQSLWAALNIGGLQPLAQAAVLALIAAATVKLRREPALFADRSRVAALSVAILLGLQLAADYWAFLYVIWVVPLLGMSLLSERVPEPARERAVAASAVPTLLPSPSR